MVWKPLHHPMIQDGYLISDSGDIKCEISPENEYRSELYHSTNGYDYAMFIVKEEYRINNSLFMLFPIDEIIAIAFIPIPEELTNKRITVKHIDGDTHNIDLVNLEWIEDIEEWRDVDDPAVCSGMYEVSSWGRIRNKNTDMIVNGSLSKKYMSVNLKSSFGNGCCSRHINRLVAMAFVKGASMSRCIVNHINGNKLYNVAKNLEWVTYSENVRHAFLCGLNIPCRGEESVSAKITQDMAKHIWLLLIDDPDTLNGRPPTGGSPTRVKQYIDSKYDNVTVSIISNIKRDKKWGNISFDKEFYFKPYAMSQDMAKHIWLLLIDDPDTLNGRPPTGGSALLVRNILKSEGYDVKLDMINSIKHKEAWCNVTNNMKQVTFKPLHPKLITQDMAKHIWLLLIDDPDTLNGRPPTGGSPSCTLKYLEDEGHIVSLSTIKSIKYRTSWKNISYERTW